MLTNTRREQLKEWRGIKVREYPMGPLRVDQPLKVYEPPANRVPWWVEIALAAGFVVVVLVDLVAFVLALGWR